MVQFSRHEYAAIWHFDEDMFPEERLTTFFDDNIRTRYVYASQGRRNDGNNESNRPHRWKSPGAKPSLLKKYSGSGPLALRKSYVKLEIIELTFQTVWKNDLNKQKKKKNND